MSFSEPTASSPQAGGFRAEGPEQRSMVTFSLQPWFERQEGPQPKNPELLEGMFMVNNWGRSEGFRRIDNGVV